jgi:hypothetical protein
MKAIQHDYSTVLIRAYLAAFPTAIKSWKSASGVHILCKSLSLKSRHQQLVLMYDKPYRGFLFLLSPFFFTFELRFNSHVDWDSFFRCTFVSKEVMKSSYEHI